MAFPKPSPNYYNAGVAYAYTTSVRIPQELQQRMSTGKKSAIIVAALRAYLGGAAICPLCRQQHRRSRKRSVSPMESVA
jgi:hypothetical protein